MKGQKNLRGYFCTNYFVSKIVLNSLISKVQPHIWKNEITKTSYLKDRSSTKIFILTYVLQGKNKDKWRKIVLNLYLLSKKKNWKKVEENAYFRALLGYSEIASHSFHTRNNWLEFIIILKVYVNSDLSNRYAASKSNYLFWDKGFNHGEFLSFYGT